MNWSDKGIQGSQKFVNKFYEVMSLLKIGKSSPMLESKLNKGIKEISELIENFKYNLAIIKLRSLLDVFVEENEVSKSDYFSYLKLISVFCPHIAEELWTRVGNKNFISLSDWPVADLKKIDEKLEQQEQMAEKAVGDIMNILKIIQDKGAKPEKVYLYVMPKETEAYSSEKLSLKIGKPVKIFAVNDKNKYDPEQKSKKAKPGKPGIFVE